MANSRNKRPTSPSIRSKGINTATKEILMETTVKPTSETPLMAAIKGLRPFSICREMFSKTTMASSTTKPVATVSAMSDRLLRLNPHKYIAVNVPISETGTAIAGISVARPERKKSSTTRITSAIAIINALSTSAREALMVGVLSCAT
ncbi:Uncharacterised protein [Providencia alcalifaciens]|nr:Uncharacterised protein [Providencia alcalifaciens]